MASIVRARISSEDEKKSTVEIKAPANLAIVFMEPATVAEQLGESQDTVRWRLSAEVKIGLLPPLDLLGGLQAPQNGDDPETYSASLATILLPPVHHARQAVAIWHWPISSTALTAGRPMGLVLRWESDRARAFADVLVLASDAPGGPQGGLCGLFALPFPGSSEVLHGFPGTGR